MTTQGTVGHYNEHGWVVVEGVFTPEEAERIAEISQMLSEKEEMREDQGQSYKLDISEDGRTAPRKIDHPFLKHPAFQSFVLDVRLEKILTLLLGDRPLLKGDQIFMKPPDFGSAKPYHQDNFYFQCHPGGHVITAWIALDDVDEDNGCLRYISGSQKEGIVPHQVVPGRPYDVTPEPECIDLKREALAPVRKGGVVFHHCETLHTSHRNTSDRWRRGYATQWVTADVTTGTDSLERAHFNQPEYEEIILEARASRLTVGDMV